MTNVRRTFPTRPGGSISTADSSNLRERRASRRVRVASPEARSMATADVCVIYNPAAGRGRAGRRLQRFRRVLGARVEFRPTSRAGHAEDLALEAARDG